MQIHGKVIAFFYLAPRQRERHYFLRNSTMSGNSFSGSSTCGLLLSPTIECSVKIVCEALLPSGNSGEQLSKIFYFNGTL
jgi:hypothetical protein